MKASHCQNCNLALTQESYQTGRCPACGKQFTETCHLGTEFSSAAARPSQETGVATKFSPAANRNLPDISAIGDARPRAEKELGQQIATFSSSWSKNWIDLGIGLFLFAGAVYGITKETGAPAQFSTILLMVFFVGLGALGVIVLRRAYRQKKDAVVVHQNGLFVGDFKETITIFWDEIRTYSDEYYFYRYINRRRVLTLDLIDGTRVFLWDHLKNLDHLTQLVQANADDIIRAKTRRMFEETDVVRFGNLSLDPTGITYDDEFLPWSEVSRFDISDEGIEIKEKGAEYAYWHLISLGSGPNPDDFVEMAHQLLAEYGNKHQ